MGPNFAFSKLMETQVSGILFDIDKNTVKFGAKKGVNASEINYWKTIPTDLHFVIHTFLKYLVHWAAVIRCVYMKLLAYFECVHIEAMDYSHYMYSTFSAYYAVFMYTSLRIVWSFFLLFVFVFVRCAVRCMLLNQFISINVIVNSRYFRLVPFLRAFLCFSSILLLLVFLALSRWLSVHSFCFGSFYLATTLV